MTATTREFEGNGKLVQNTPPLPLHYTNAILGSIKN